MLPLPHRQVWATLLASGASLREVEFGDYKDVEQRTSFYFKTEYRTQISNSQIAAIWDNKKIGKKDNEFITTDTILIPWKHNPRTRKLDLLSGLYMLSTYFASFAFNSVSSVFFIKKLGSIVKSSNYNYPYVKSRHERGQTP